MRAQGVGVLADNRDQQINVYFTDFNAWAQASPDAETWVYLVAGNGDEEVTTVPKSQIVLTSIVSLSIT